jgi:membrane-anchored mycosin MYCP
VLCLAACVASLAFGATPASAAPANPSCPAGLAPPATAPPSGRPWPQQRYDLDRLAPIADGHSVTVAVIDSGVDASWPQLRDRVLPGVDELVHGGDGRQDCVGHGTAVASIIAAAPGQGEDALRGVAPGAKILPIRVTEVTAEGVSAARTGSASGLADAIRTAADRGARVLNVSMVLGVDDPQVAAAVRYALAHQAVVVAAVGNGHRTDGGVDPVPYPAGYPGVIGVGAIDADGQRLAQSQVGGYVKLVAPGGAVVGATAGGLAPFSGTSFAAPFVAGAAALVLQRWPELTAEQVAERLYATADPAPDAAPSPDYGYGVVNPYRAATAAPPGPTPSAPAATAPAARAAAARSHAGLGAALPLAGVGAALVVVVLLIGLTLPNGARRRWRPGN